MYLSKVVIQGLEEKSRTLFRDQADLLCESWDWINITSLCDTYETRFLVRRVEK